MPYYSIDNDFSKAKTIDHNFDQFIVNSFYHSIYYNKN